VLMVEDMQHADAGLLDFLEHLLDWARDVPIFVLTFARPELETRRAGWGTGRRNSTALTFDPLDDPAMYELLDGLVPGMPTSAKARIAGRAEGIPLYAVETVRMLIDRDIVQPIDGSYRLVGDVGELSVPATLQSLLAARLDTLDQDARRLVADAAVLGGTFPGEALVAVSDQPEPQVRRKLAELVRREVLGVRADPCHRSAGTTPSCRPCSGRWRTTRCRAGSARRDTSRLPPTCVRLRRRWRRGGRSHRQPPPRRPGGRPRRPGLTRAPRRGRRHAVPRRRTRLASRSSEHGCHCSQHCRGTTGPGQGPRRRVGRRGTAGSEPAELPVRRGTPQQPSGCTGLRLRHTDGTTVTATRPARTPAPAGSYAAQGRHDQSRPLLEHAVALLQAEPDANTVEALAELATLEAFAGRTERRIGFRLPLSRRRRPSAHRTARWGTC
jgi:hypothetical protein